MDVKQKVRAGKMDTNAEVAKRIKALRGEQTQAEFAKLLGVTQPMVSSWEAGRDVPSSEMYLRLANAAGRARSSDNCGFFLEQAGVQMDAILATAEEKLRERMGDQKQMEDEGKVVLVQAFAEGLPTSAQKLPQLSVEASQVAHKASTYYIKMDPPPWPQDSQRRGFVPGETIVFDTFRASPDVENFNGEEVLVRLERRKELPGGFFLGRLLFVGEGHGSKKRHIVLAPSDRCEGHFGELAPGSPSWPGGQLIRLGRSHDYVQNAGHQSAARVDNWYEFSDDNILGRVIARFPAGSTEEWKRRAHGPV